MLLLPSAACRSLLMLFLLGACRCRRPRTSQIALLLLSSPATNKDWDWRRVHELGRAPPERLMTVSGAVSAPCGDCGAVHVHRVLRRVLLQQVQVAPHRVQLGVQRRHIRTRARPAQWMRHLRF